MNVKDAMGEVIASMMKHDTLDHYRRERDEKIGLSDPTCTGHYEGCLAEADEYIARLETRGYRIVPIDTDAKEEVNDDDQIRKGIARFNYASMLLYRTMDFRDIIREYIRCNPNETMAAIAVLLDVTEEHLWDILEMKSPAPDADTRYKWMTWLGVVR